MSRTCSYNLSVIGPLEGGVIKDLVFEKVPKIAKYDRNWVVLVLGSDGDDAYLPI